MFFDGHFVIVACVFMHIAGSIFIFNISKGQRPIPDLEEHIPEPPQWGGALRKSTIDNRQSTIDNRNSAGAWNLPSFA
jgi:hypothetical protein